MSTDCTIFPTALGWAAAVWNDSLLAGLTFGHPTATAAWQRLRHGEGAEAFFSQRYGSDKRDRAGEGKQPIANGRAGDTPVGLDQLDSDQVDLVHRLQAYAAGAVDDFDDVALDQTGLTRFQREVVKTCRRIPYGQTESYAELARRAGTPRAARAVGNCMARNRFPLIVPCHRVVASGGRLGGYSAPQGLSMKQRLLQLEGAAQPAGTATA